MKDEITFQIDAQILCDASTLAVEERESGSSMPVDGLEQPLGERPRAHQEYDLTLARAIALLRQGLDLQWTPALSRDELHQR